MTSPPPSPRPRLPTLREPPRGQATRGTMPGTDVHSRLAHPSRKAQSPARRPLHRRSTRRRPRTHHDPAPRRDLVQRHRRRRPTTPPATQPSPLLQDDCQSGPASALTWENKLYAGRGGAVPRSSGLMASVEVRRVLHFCSSTISQEIALHAFDSPSSATQVRAANEPTTLLDADSPPGPTSWWQAPPRRTPSKAPPLALRLRYHR